MIRILQRRGTEAKEIRSLSISACAGETLSLQFEITSDDDIAQLHVSESQDEKFTGSKSEDVTFDLYIVKTWESAGVGIYQSHSMLVEELLLKDDRINLHDGYKKEVNSWKEIFKPIWFYQGPKLPEHAELRTSLGKGDTKIIFLRTTVSEKAGAASYQKCLKFTINGGNVIELPVTVEVLSCKLLEPDRTFFIWYKGRLDRKCPQHYLPEKTYKLQLQDIKAHGFDTISICEVDTLLAQRAIDIAEEVGFEQVVLVPPLPELSKLTFKHAKPIIYVSDELDMHLEFPGNEKPESLIEYHRLNWQRAQTIGASTMASVLSSSFVKRFERTDDIGCAPEFISVYLNRNREYIQFAKQLSATMPGRLLFYWQCYMEKPNLNRVLAGAYLWKTGAEGISPYCYQHMPVYPNSPFDDFDEWEPDFHESGIDRPFKDHMTTYPAQEAIIPTLQWEALRDGIIDYRFWYTLDHLIEQFSNSENKEAADLASAAQTRRDGTLSRIDMTSIRINSETEIEPYDEIDTYEYDEFRSQLRNDIAALQTFLTIPGEKG